MIDRLNGAVVSEMTSMCNHVSSLKKHPMDDDSVLERCSECQVIRIYNTKTKNCNIVHSATEIVRLSDGPNGSIVVLDAEGLLSKLEWSTETQKSLRTHVQSLSFGRKIQKMCFVKCHDIFVAILSYNNKQIMAWKSGNYYSPTWKLTGSVNGVNIDPVSLTSDTEGNVYIDDGANDRILQIKQFYWEGFEHISAEEELGNDKGHFLVQNRRSFDSLEGQPNQQLLLHRVIVWSTLWRIHDFSFLGTTVADLHR